MKIKKFNESNDSSEYLKSKCTTVSKLKKMLDKYPDNMLVAIGSGNCDFIFNIETTCDNDLYYNGDSPEFIYELKNDEVLYIKGIE